MPTRIANDEPTPTEPEPVPDEPTPDEPTPTDGPETTEIPPDGVAIGVEVQES